MLDALERLVDVDGFAAMGSLTTLAYLAYSSGSGTESVQTWLARLEAVTRPPPPGTAQAHLDQTCRYFVRAVINPQRADDEVLALVRARRYVELPEAPELLAAVEMSAGGIAWLLGETGAAIDRLGRALELMESMHYTAMVPQTLSGLGQARFDAAMYDEVDHIGRLLIDLADAENLGFVGEVGRVLRAEVAGVRGDAVRARELCEEVLLRIDVGQSIALECFVRLSLAYARFGENDLAGSFEQLSGLFHADGDPVHSHISYLFLADTVAAAVRAGQAAAMAPVMEVAQVRLVDAPSRSRFQLARATALLAGDDAERLHLAATTDTHAAQWPFQLANAQLEYGVWLRRRRRPTAARGQLEAALETFHRLGTPAWADLARAELRASGVATEPATSAWADLTAQERHIVRMAASGMTNREIGASLYLSPRTVSAHLYNAFPKLGVTARSQLRDIVEARESR